MNWQEGEKLKPLTKPQITREQLQAYAQASGDRNPVHLDDDYAKSLGFPSVIAHGMLSMAFLADHARFNFPEDRFQIKRLKAKFRKVTVPGDVLTCDGVVKKVEGSEIVVSLSLTNQAGEVTTDGEACFSLLS